MLLPGTFVVLWSTGFVFGKLGMPATKPFTFLEIRYLIVIALMTIIAVVTRAPWPKRGELWRIGVAGLVRARVAQSLSERHHATAKPATSSSGTANPIHFNTRRTLTLVPRSHRKPQEGCSRMCSG